MCDIYNQASKRNGGLPWSEFSKPYIFFFSLSLNSFSLFFFFFSLSQIAACCGSMNNVSTSFF